MNPVIEVKGLTKSYGAIRGVEDVSFNVEPGQAVALMGPNGSGKTTILRCVAGLLRPDSGTMKVCGEDLHRRRRTVRRKFCYLPQKASFPLCVSAREIAEFHAKLRGLNSSQAFASLREAGIGSTEELKRFGELSDGMRQRLSLAVVGMAAVNVMLLDEPTANLDPEAVLRLRELAQRWRGEGRSLLFSTHMLDDVEELADTAVVLVEGKKVAEENVAGLKADLRRSALLRVDVGSPTQAHLSAALECGATDAKLNSHDVIITAPVEHRYNILKRLGDLGTVNHFETEEPSLEHLYMKYVQEGRR